MPANSKQQPQEKDPGYASVRNVLLYGISLPERTLRSAAGVVSGALRESADLLVPQAFKSSKSYHVFIRQGLTFLAEDDLGVAQVVVWGRETGDPVLDSGQVFSCTEAICPGSWPVTRTQEISASWTFMALAFDVLNQGSGPVRTVVVIRPPE